MAETQDPFEAFARRTGGWSVLDDPVGPVPFDQLPEEHQVALEEAALRQYELNASIARCFSSDDGMVVLDWMREVATEGARFDIVNDTDPRLAAAKGFFREGQAAFYFDIRNRMAAAEDGPPIVQRQQPPNTRQTKPKTRPQTKRK